MAQRGVCTITGSGNWQEEGRTQITFDYRGFQHPDEGFGAQVDMSPSVLTGAALKSTLRDLIETWYGNNPSGNYDEWDDTPVVGDNFILVGGIL